MQIGRPHLNDLLSHREPRRSGYEQKLKYMNFKKLLINFMLIKNNICTHTFAPIVDRDDFATMLKSITIG
ncbi:hypothetical protein SAMN05216516_10456 [Izhakiella capsodis]|uniref:Uncharacterized protein n=1 Tax=Izhakiella capsodis TaxID=1367852 RepID=A0A1I4XCH4_9GAMM|nr:hypothetical protein SAMN05216516_10456 [Izhakiella capsodis]